MAITKNSPEASERGSNTGGKNRGFEFKPTAKSPPKRSLHAPRGPRGRGPPPSACTLARAEALTTETFPPPPLTAEKWPCP